MFSILRINTATYSTKTESFDSTDYLLGGRTLSSRLVSREVPATCDPLGKKNKLFFCTGVLAGTIVSSTDGINWTEQTTLPGGESLRSIVFGVDSQFIAVGTNGTLAYSTTGVDGSWATANAGTIDLNSIARNTVFIAVGDAGANVSGK